MSFFEDIDIDKLLKILRYYNPQEPLLFNSGLFIWLFAAFILVYILLNRKDTLRIIYVTLFSYYFSVLLPLLFWSLLRFLSVKNSLTSVYGIIHLKSFILQAMHV